MTINGLGGGGKTSQNLSFPRRGLSKKIFPGECLSKLLFFSWKEPLKIYFSWRVPLKIYFFPEKGLRNFFFSIFSGPTSRSLMVVPYETFCLFHGHKILTSTDMSTHQMLGAFCPYSQWLSQPSVLQSPPFPFYNTFNT